MLHPYPYKVTVPVTGGGLVGRGLGERAWVGPGQRAGSGEAAAGCRIPRLRFP